MADLSDKMHDMQQKGKAKMQGMKVDAKARMEQMRNQNSQHSANEE